MCARVYSLARSLSCTLSFHFNNLLLLACTSFPLFVGLVVSNEVLAEWKRARDGMKEEDSEGWLVCACARSRGQSRSERVSFCNDSNGDCFLSLYCGAVRCAVGGLVPCEIEREAK